MSLLSQIRNIVTIDVDSMDPDVAIRHTHPSESFCDMTSNQAIVWNETQRLERHNNVKEAIAYVKGQGLEPSAEEFDQDVADVLNVLLAKDVYPQLTGNVLIQTSPSAAYDTQKTIKHAQKLVALFEANGIPRQRVCIKIPTTPESIVACQYLERNGIQTLATCVFSVAQAQAASQAGCAYVAPYFNELRVHFEPVLWKKYDDTVNQHAMCSVIGAVIQLYKAIKSKTLVIPASIVTVDEVLALVSLRPDHLTLSGSVLDELASLPAVPVEQLKLFDGIPAQSLPEVDYLVSEAASLKEAIESDAEVTRKLEDALKIFDEAELKTKAYIRVHSGL